MKILCYSSYYLPYISGITTTTSHILTSLSDKHKITVLTFNYDKRQKPIEISKRINVVRMPWILKISKGFISPSSIATYLDELQKHDVIMVNLPNVEALLLVILAKIYKKRVIALFHCDLDLGSSFFSKIITSVVRAAVLVQLALSDEIIAYPDYLTGHPYKKWFHKKIKTCFPVADLAYPDQKYIKELRKISIGISISYIGRMAREKGIEYLLGACERLKNRKVSYTLFIAGPTFVAGEGSYQDKIIKLLRENNISHKFLGELSKKELSSLYRISDVVVIPSINGTEAISIVQLEALLAGTPVVATSLPGVRLPIQLTNLGVIVKPKNTEEIADAIIKITKNPSSFRTSGNISKSKQEFDKKRVFQFYAKLFS